MAPAVLDIKHATVAQSVEQHIRNVQVADCP